MSIVNKLLLFLLNKKMASDGKKVMKHLEELSKDPMPAQKEFLLKLLQDNKDTDFGKKYDFASIDSIEEYIKRVPVSSYDDYIRDINSMAIDGKKDVLTAYEVGHYSKTSGTMGNPKKIPYSEMAAKMTSSYAINYMYALLAKHKLLSANKSINLGESSLVTLKSGASYGAYSAKATMNNKGIFERLTTPPVAVLIPKYTMNTRYLQAFYALKEKNLGSGMCAFYSYFLEILRYIEKNWEMLADDIELGRIDESIDVHEEVRIELESKLKPDPKRANEIRQIFASPSHPLVPKLWPKFKYLIGVGTGGFSTYTEKLKVYFGPNIHFYMIGVVASEGAFSVPVGINSGESVLLPNSIFYEFRPEGSDDYSNLLTLDQLEVGKNYELVLTNLSGFYRYKMRDIIKVVGMHNNTPTIEFCYRADETVSLVGEKTTEYALREVVKASAKECGLDAVDYCMHPNADAEPVRYEFLIEPSSYLPNDFDYKKLRDTIDKHLSIANPSMGDKLNKGIVGQSELYMLQEETNLLYRDIMILKGTASAQLKPARILDNPWRKKFFYQLRDKRFYNLNKQ